MQYKNPLPENNKFKMLAWFIYVCSKPCEAKPKGIVTVDSFNLEAGATLFI